MSKTDAIAWIPLLIVSINVVIIFVALRSRLLYLFGQDHLFLSGIKLGKFKPCVIYNEHLRLTEIILKDCMTVWCPWGPYKGHAVDCGYGPDGELVGIKIWDDVRFREERPVRGQKATQATPLTDAFINASRPKG